MIARTLAIALLAALGTAWAAPMPFIPKVKKHTGLTPAEIAKSFHGTYRVVSYEYGNAARLRAGRAIARAAVWSEVVIKDGSWTQIRDIGGRKLETTYALKIDATKPVPTFTLTYTGNPDPTLLAFLRLDFSQLLARHGSVVGIVVPRPKVIPVEDDKVTR